MYQPEEPRVVGDEKPLYNFARKIADWVANKDRLTSKGAWIAGVYGPRGSGKTSLLWTIYNILRGRNTQEASKAGPVSCVLPEKEQPLEAVFAPAATRANDDLLFMLLDHLEERAPRASATKGFDEARKAEITRKDLDRFLKYEQEIATSSRDIPDRLIRVHKEGARATLAIRRAFESVLSSLKTETKILPIFVDDLDLQPQRALELLEILHLFLNNPGIVVLIAADKDLLLHSIDQALEAEKRRHPGLASALLAKYVPHEWLLPTPTEAERFDFLWSSHHAGAPDLSELRRWWPDDAVQGLHEARVARRSEMHASRVSEQEDDEPTREDDGPLPENAEEMAHRYLLPMAPATYRGLKGCYNRLLGWRERLESVSPNEREKGFLQKIYQRYTDLGLNRRLLGPFLTMMAAIDVQWPELELLIALERSPKVVELVLSMLASESRRSAGTMASGSTADVDSTTYQTANWRETLLGVGPEDLPVLSVLLQRTRFTGSDRGEAKRHMRLLAGAFDEWRRFGGGALGTGKRAEVRFLAISFNSNALEGSSALWSSFWPREAVERWHLDLSDLVLSEPPTPGQIRRARDRARAFLRDEAQITSFQGQLEVFAQAPLPLLIWIGWLLDRQRSVIVYNDKTRTPFVAPAERITFGNRGSYAIAKPEIKKDRAAEPGNAVAIIDLTLDHKANSGQLDRFQHAGAPVRYAVGYLLTRLSGELIKQEDLVPILRDMLELIGSLREAHDIRHLHLALAGPDVVAFFFGQQLRAQGMTISLYQLLRDHYEWVFDLEETPPAQA